MLNSFFKYMPRMSCADIDAALAAWQSTYFSLTIEEQVPTTINVWLATIPPAPKFMAKPVGSAR
jgi:hypothetical protein